MISPCQRPRQKQRSVLKTTLKSETVTALLLSSSSPWHARAQKQLCAPCLLARNLTCICIGRVALLLPKRRALVVVAMPRALVVLLVSANPLRVLRIGLSMVLKLEHIW